MKKFLVYFLFVVGFAVGCRSQDFVNFTTIGGNGGSPLTGSGGIVLTTNSGTINIDGSTIGGSTNALTAGQNTLLTNAVQTTETRPVTFQGQVKSANAGNPLRFVTLDYFGTSVHGINNDGINLYDEAAVGINNSGTPGSVQPYVRLKGDGSRFLLMDSAGNEVAKIDTNGVTANTYYGDGSHLTGVSSGTLPEGIITNNTPEIAVGDLNSFTAGVIHGVENTNTLLNGVEGRSLTIRGGNTFYTGTPNPSGDLYVKAGSGSGNAYSGILYIGGHTNSAFQGGTFGETYFKGIFRDSARLAVNNDDATDGQALLKAGNDVVWGSLAGGGVATSGDNTWTGTNNFTGTFLINGLPPMPATNVPTLGGTNVFTGTNTFLIPLNTTNINFSSTNSPATNTIVMWGQIRSGGTNYYFPLCK